MTTASHAAHRVGHVSLHHDSASAALALAQRDQALRLQRERLHTRHAYYYAAGRILLAGVFLAAAIAKIVLFSETRRAMDTLGLASPEWLLTTAVTIELAAGTLLAAGLWVHRSATLLIGYVAAVTLLIFGDLSLAANRVAAVANLGLVGSLLMLIAHGGGAFSLDSFFAHRAARKSAGT